MVDSRSLGSWPRRIIGAIVVVGLLVLALMTFQLAPGLPRTPVAGPPPSAGPSTTSTDSPATESPSTAESPSGSPSASASTSPTPEPGGLPGPGTTEPGISIVAALDSDESFTIVERIRLDAPIDLLTLNPIALDRLGRDFTDETATVSELEIISGGEPQIVPDGDVTSSVEVPLSDPSDTIVLRYRLDGTVVRTLPSTTGRGLGAVGPLAADVPDDLPVTVSITGKPVINLYCPTLELAAQACATGDVPDLRAKDPLPWNDALVVAQLNLAIPR